MCHGSQNPREDASCKGKGLGEGRWRAGQVTRAQHPALQHLSTSKSRFGMVPRTWHQTFASVFPDSLEIGGRIPGLGSLHPTCRLNPSWGFASPGSGEPPRAGAWPHRGSPQPAGGTAGVLERQQPGRSTSGTPTHTALAGAPCKRNSSPPLCFQKQQ